MSEQKMTTSNRWAIAIAGIVMQLCLGTVYAWSVYNRPLVAEHGWEMGQVTMVFTIVIVCLSAFAVVGGYILDSKGPRLVATLSGIFFPVGLFIAAYGASAGNLYVIYLGYGLISGIGLGFGYITPIATLVKWFPDKRGLITGLAVMGFGLGSGFMSILVPQMLGAGMSVSTIFIVFGCVFLVLVLVSAQFMKVPPPGYKPEGWEPPAGAPAAAGGSTLGEAVRDKGFYICWLMLGINIMAGMAVISVAANMAQNFMPDTIADKATLAGILILVFAISNGIFRPVWASLSDKIGRAQVFLILFASQAALFLILGFAPQNLILFVILITYQYSCLGGGFATMPAMAADKFGTKFAGRIYGWMLTAWGVAGIIGPQIYRSLSAPAVDGEFPAHAFKTPLIVTGVILAVAVILPIIEILTNKKPKPST